MTDADRAQPAEQPSRDSDSLKDTLISIVIAFALAFVGRSYVIEPFVIPTGSMGPTLNGAHMRFRSPASGFNWVVNPRDVARGSSNPLPVQGSRRSNRPISVSDPVTGIPMSRFDVPLRSGDRIVVLKYLYAISDPHRFDVVVFKNPENPQENFIKRLLGLPGEELWLCDGDLFVRKPESDDPALRAWRVQRKPRRVQEAVWWPVFSSEYAPLDDALLGRSWRGPFSGEGWDTSGREYRAETADPGALTWDDDAWPITDYTPYNQTVERLISGGVRRFPVSDIRLHAGVKPDDKGLAVTATLLARQHEFQGVIRDGRAVVRMRAVGVADWTDLGEGEAPEFAPGRTVKVQFIHVDQSLELRVGEHRVAFGVYNWTPEERLAFATVEGAQEARGLPLSQPRFYRKPEVSWSFAGSPVTLYRVGLDRDLHWRTDPDPRGGAYARATAPGSTFQLRAREHFMCGDNSTSSRDSRMWDSVDPWVAATIDDRVGVVPRDLMMGRAFFVYFPSPHGNLGPIPVPDFGRMRFIK